MNTLYNRLLNKGSTIENESIADFWEGTKYK